MKADFILYLKVHMWEESPVGVWTLEVFNDGRAIVELKDWKLVFWGTETPPQPGTEVKYPPTVGAEVQPPTPAISPNPQQVPPIQPPPQPAGPPVNIDRGMPAVPPESVDLVNNKISLNLSFLYHFYQCFFRTTCCLGRPWNPRWNSSRQTLV
jgi:hypothetical protein